jgi:hypothetical protein
LEWIKQLQNLNEPDSEIRNWLHKNESKWVWIPKWYKKQSETIVSYQQ